MGRKLIKLRGEYVSRRVWLNEKELHPGRSREVRNHSRYGFMWGHKGSGAAQLALAILLELTDKQTALLWYQDFRWEFVARLPRGDFEVEIPESWLQRLGKTTKIQVPR